MKKQRTTRKPKTKPTKVKKVVRVSKKGKKESISAFQTGRNTPSSSFKNLPAPFKNLISKIRTRNKQVKQTLKNKILFFYERRESDSIKDINRALAQAKTNVYYNPELRFRSYNPFGNKTGQKMWVDNFTGKKGVWRKWEGEYKRTPTGKIKKKKNPITGEMQEQKIYRSIMEKEYLKVSKEMQIRLLQKNDGLNREEAVIEYQRLSARGRTYVFEQIGSRI